jgi:hypothetical protein
VKALVSRFDGGSQSRDGNRKWKRNRDGNKGGGKNHGKLTTALRKGSMTLTDIAGNRLTLHDVCYVPESQDQILSMMKFRREHSAHFQFTGLETFEMKAANGFELSGRSINNILHTSLSSQPEVNVAATRSITAAVRNEAKRKQVTEILSDSEPEENNPDPDSDSEPELQIAGAAAHNAHNDVDDTAIVPLICKPRDLWHLRYGHASTTVLRKLRLIKSIFDSCKCTPCLRAKKTRKPFPPSESKAEAKLERNIIRKIEWQLFDSITTYISPIVCEQIRPEISSRLFQQCLHRTDKPLKLKGETRISNSVVLLDPNRDRMSA